MLTAATALAPASLDEFKQRTQAKLKDVTCPRHRQPPRLRFEGDTLRDVRVSLSGCCNRLIEMANKAIAS
jgi:hypothetical protein